MKKTIKRVLFFSSFFLLLTSSSCETNDIETGDESFSCYINGQLFIPKANVNLLGTLPHQNNLSFGKDSSFLIRAANQDYGIFFSIENFSLGEFNLSESDGNNFNYQLSHIIIRTREDKTYLSKDNSGSVTFTEVSDTNVEGTFEFTLYNENDETDIIKITKGKFND
jgi:hypothetical protein